MKFNSNHGFTLIEILVVVVIVSLLTVLGVQMISSGSIERHLQQHGKRLQSSLEFACDQATLQNIPYGVAFSQTGYQFFIYVNQNWQVLNFDNTNLSHEFTDGSQISLSIDDQPLVLKEDYADKPQLLCDNTGQLSPFELLISDTSKQHQFQLKTSDYWTIESRWLDE